MDANTKALLQRWRALREGVGAGHALNRIRVLWVLGFLCCLVAGFGILYGWSAILIAVASAACGWLVAETNALRSRLRQWPFFARYIDWRRVDEDLGSSDT